SIRPWENPAIGVPLIMLAASLSALWLWARWPRGWSGALLIAVLVLDLGSFGWFQEWRGSPPSSALDRPSVLADYGNALAVAHQRLTPLRGISQTPELAAPNLSRVWALPSAAGYNPYLLERYRTLVSMDPTGPLRLDALSPENTALNILAVRYLFAPALPADSPEAQTLAADPSRWRKIQNLLSGAVYENEGALPRARLVPEVLTVSPSQDLAAI